MLSLFISDPYNADKAGQASMVDLEKSCSYLIAHGEQRKSVSRVLARSTSAVSRHR